MIWGQLSFLMSTYVPAYDLVFSIPTKWSSVAAGWRYSAEKSKFRRKQDYTYMQHAYTCMCAYVHVYNVFIKSNLADCLTGIVFLRNEWSRTHYSLYRKDLSGDVLQKINMTCKEIVRIYGLCHSFGCIQLQTQPVLSGYQVAEIQQRHCYIDIIQTAE